MTNDKVKILIVEDESVIALQLQKTLENFGYTVCAIADSGEEALIKAEEQEPDLALMDIFLQGGMDGIEAGSRIQTRFDVPVIFLSAFMDDGLLERAKAAKPFGYLVKPFQEKELHTAIELGLYKKKTERELLSAKEKADKARKEAEEANQLKDKFVSLVAHDLRSPFSAILGFMKLIMEETDPPLHEKHRIMFERAVNQGKALVDLVQGLLDVSRFKTGKIRPHPGFIDGHFHVLSALMELKPLAERKKIVLASEIPPGTRLYADPDLLDRVIWNLINNAVKFCREGDNITLYIPPGEKSTIAVKDTGIGIAESRHAAIFRYEEVTTTTGTAGEKGTGLGLPLSRDIMEALGGTLELESEPGKGSVFYARLPFVRPVVLIVDDDEGIRLMVRKFLKKADPEILEAENGKDALEKLAVSLIHLVITDINMPGMDGFCLVEKIRNTLSLKDIPVIVLTTDMEEKTRERVFQAGANDFVNKPIAMEDFMPRVRRYIG
ncbi:MAG: response regulator [Nitrospinae bacterium]|nr:response regulator [Nitrospinota bacterium]